MGNSASAPSITDNPNHTGLITWIFFVSCLFWIPYTLFMFYLFHEHNVRKQYPQNFILLLFSLGCLCRCIWFGLYSDFGYYNAMQVLNRVSILFQFSAVSLLLLMWSRALKVSESVDKLAMNNRIVSGRFNLKSIAEGTRVIPSGLDNGQSPVLERIPTVNANSGLERNSTWVDNSTRNSFANPTPRGNEPELQRKRVIWTVGTISAWIIVLGTIIGNPDSSSDMYIYNMISLVVLSFSLSVGILVVGLQNWHRLRKELSTVYTSGVSNTNESGQSPVLNRSSVKGMALYYVCCYCGANSGCFGVMGYFSEIWDILFSSARHRHAGGQVRLRIQTEVLRIVLVVSLSVSFFFLLRCYAFSYYSIFEQQFGVKNAPLADKYYPYLFYQFPEFFPNLLIARGISPPKGILKRIQVNIGVCFSSCFGALTMWQRCKEGCGKGGNSRSHSEDSAKSGSSASTPKVDISKNRNEQAYEDRLSLDSFGYSPHRARMESDDVVVVNNPIVRHPSAVEEGARISMANGANRTLSDELSDYIYSISSYDPSYNVSRNTSVNSSITNKSTHSSRTNTDQSRDTSTDKGHVELSESFKSMDNGSYLDNLEDYY